MTPSAIRSEIDQLARKLLVAEIAIDLNPIIRADVGDNTSIVTWVNCTPSADQVFATLGEYRSLVRNRQFSVIVLDGSLLQFAYRFRRRTLVEHRLCFYPCPFPLKPDEWARYQDAGFGLLDILDYFDLNEYEDRIRLQSPLRFDFDLENVAANHPATHLHISRDGCRVPVFAPLSVGHFARFVFMNFFPEQWEAHEFLRTWPRTRYDRTLASCDRTQLHLECVTGLEVP